MVLVLRKLPASPIFRSRRYGYGHGYGYGYSYGYHNTISSISDLSKRPLSFHTNSNTGDDDGSTNDCRRYRRWHQRNCVGSTISTTNTNNTRIRCFSSLPRRKDKTEGEDAFFDDMDYSDSNNNHDHDDDNDEGDHQEAEAYASAAHPPWKTLLEAPARAAWRASDPQRDPPDYLRAAMYSILDDGSRTSKQLKRAHRKVLSIQSDLVDLREKERRIMVNGKRHFKQQQQQQQEREREQQLRHNNDSDSDYNDRENWRADNSSDAMSSSKIHPVNYGYDETLATLKHRLEPNFAITKRVLSECQSLLGGKMVQAASTATAASGGDDGDGTKDNKQSHYYSHHWQPKRILDFGIGCGSASAAAIDFFGSSDNNSNSNNNSESPSSPAIEWIHGIDPSQTMRECSKKLIEEMTRGHSSHDTTTKLSPPPPPRITFSNSLTPFADESSSSGDGSFDLALFAYTATDLPDVASCLAAAAMAFEKLKPNGVFVMIEPGTPDGFNSTRAVRNMLLDCCPPNDSEFEWEDRCHIIAPCTHNGSCPMERHKKDFFLRKKPIGKLGHDLPQELEDNGLDDDDSDDESEELDVDDQQQDHVELSFHDSLKMSETEAFNSSFCSFVHSVAGDSRSKGEKFSYLVAQKQRFRVPAVDANGDAITDDDPSTEGDPFRKDNVTELLTNALDAASLQADDMAYSTFERAQDLSSRYIDSENDDLGLELLQGEGKRQSMGRIVRAPIKKKGHVYIDYCAGPGRIIRSRVTKALSNSVAPGIYAAARKSRWGGLWPDTMDKLLMSEYNNDKKKTKK